MLKAKAPKSLDWLREHQPGLLAAFRRDHSEERAVEIANSILEGLDAREKPKYDVKRLNGHYSAERISENAETKEKVSKRFRREINSKLEQRIRNRAKANAGLS